MADTSQFNPQSFGSRAAGDDADHSVQQDFARIGSDLVDALGSRAEEIVTEQKSRAAGEIASLGAMVRNAAQCIDQGNRGAVSEYATEMADEIERFAARLRLSSWRVLAADLEDFARRWPGAFMASSAIAGFLLGRMVMAPPETPAATPAWSPGTAAPEPVARPASTPVGGTLSQGGATSGFGQSAGEETR